MEVDFQSLFGLHVHSFIHGLRPQHPPPAVGLVDEGAIGCFVYYLLKVHLYRSSKITVIRKSCVCLLMEGSVQRITDPDP
jgi:hypothetical protein